MEPRRKPLAALVPGETGTLLRIDLSKAVRGRMEELGLLPGTTIRCLYCAPGGTLAAYAFGGAVFALRACDAAQIEVEAAP